MLLLAPKLDHILLLLNLLESGLIGYFCFSTNHTQMLPLVTALNAIQKIANDFSGDFSIKNSNGKYIYVNEGWLKSTARTSDESLGKSVEEIFSSDLVKLVTDSDKIAWESNEPVIYDNELVINGELVKSVVI
jgi:hypothetical protein